MNTICIKVEAELETQQFKRDKHWTMSKIQKQFKVD